MSPSDEILSQAVWKDSARDEEDRCTRLLRVGRLADFVRGGVTSGVGGFEGRRGVNMPAVWLSEMESALRGVRSSSMPSSWFAPGGVNGGAGAAVTVPFWSGEAGWARSPLGIVIPLRGSALWDLKSGRPVESTDAPIISTPGIMAGTGS